MANGRHIICTEQTLGETAKWTKMTIHIHNIVTCNVGLVSKVNISPQYHQ